MSRHKTPTHERSYMVARTTFINGQKVIICYDRKLLPKLTDHVKPTAASLTQGEYVFRDRDGFITRGFLLEKLPGGAIMSVKRTRLSDRHEWVEQAETGRVTTGQIIGRAQDFDNRVHIYDKLIAGKIIALGYHVDQEPEGLFESLVTEAAPEPDPSERADVPIF